MAGMRPGGGGGPGFDIGAILGLVQRFGVFILVAAAIAAVKFGMIDLPPSDLKKVLGSIPLDGLVGVLVAFFSFVEGWRRRGNSILDLADFLVVPAGFFYLGFFNSFPPNVQVGLGVAVAAMMVVATLHNEARQGGGILGRIDVTPLFVLSGLLLMARVFSWELSPPKIVPGIAIVAVFLATMVRETFGRSPTFAALGIGAAAIAGMSGNSLLILATLLGIVVLATFAGRVVRIQPRETEQSGIMGVTLVMPWDVMIAALFTIAFVPQLERVMAVVGL